MEELKVGGRFSALAGRREGTYFEVSESGPMWVFYYSNPSEKEIGDMSEGHPFEIRSMTKGVVLWVFVKCGNQEWAEAPYSPHLSQNVELPPVADATSGYALTLVMVDKNTDTIRHIRVIGLGNRFSKKLYADISDLAAAPFDAVTYDRLIAGTQMAYTTPQMVAMCANYWKLK